MSTRCKSTSLAASAVLVGLVFWVPRPAASIEAGTDTKPLERVDVVDLSDRVRVQVDGGRPVSYTMATSLEPIRVTVELPGFSKGKDLHPLGINKPPLLEVIPSEVSKPQPAVQLVFRLASRVTPEARAEGTRFIIDFPKGQPSGEAATPAASTGVQGQPTAGGQAQPDPQLMLKTTNTPATKVTKVEVQRDEDEATVVIHGDGEFHYDIKRLNQDRLIVDLANVTSPLRLQVLPVDHPLLKQIRVGQHAQKIRLVLDLPKPSIYSVRSQEQSLTVRLTGFARSEGPGDSARAADAGVPGSSDQVDRVAAAGPIPVPTGLGRPELPPRLAQMAPEVKGAMEPEEPPRYVGRRISLDFQAADITNVLRLIADVSGFNIVVGEGVKSKVTMKLVSVPWDQALDMLLKMNNLGMIREGNIVWIDTLANIAGQQEQTARAKDTKARAEDLIVEVIYIQNIEAQSLMTSIRQFVGPRGMLMVNQATNAVIVRDTETQLAVLRKAIRELDLQLPQVQIEARIVQANTTYARSLGIQWGLSNVHQLGNGNIVAFRGQGTSSSSDPVGGQTNQFLVNLPATVSGLTTTPAAGFTFGRASAALLDLRLSAGEALGLTKTISAPRIITMDKRQAKISQGSSIPYQTTSLQGTQTTFVDANLELQVTPQIPSRDPREIGKNVWLQIKATNNAPGQQTNAGPIINRREAQTQVLVKDGETIVMGGVFVDEQTNSMTGVPWLSRIPVVGWLFKNKTETISKQELLIFLTTSIVRAPSS